MKGLAAHPDDPFAGFPPQPIKCRWLSEHDQRISRLVLREIDHLARRPYTDRLMEGSLIPIEQYEGTRTAWQY